MHAAWIRDILDPLIARDGPEAISVEDALYMDQFLRKLQLATIPVQDIRLSRVHLALLEIAGRATRWPHRLIERAEAVIKVWEARFGKLADIGIELYGQGGRLQGIATASCTDPDKMLMNWLTLLEAQLGVVRRIREFIATTPSENLRSVNGGERVGELPGDWPSRGEVVLRDVSAAYG